MWKIIFFNKTDFRIEKSSTFAILLLTDPLAQLV